MAPFSAGQGDDGGGKPQLDPVSEYHLATQELLASHLQHALQALAQHHEQALQILAYRYPMRGDTGGEIDSSALRVTAMDEAEHGPRRPEGFQLPRPGRSIPLPPATDAPVLRLPGERTATSTFIPGIVYHNDEDEALQRSPSKPTLGGTLGSTLGSRPVSPAPRSALHPDHCETSSNNLRAPSSYHADTGQRLATSCLIDEDFFGADRPMGSCRRQMSTTSSKKTKKSNFHPVEIWTQTLHTAVGGSGFKVPPAGGAVVRFSMSDVHNAPSVMDLMEEENETKTHENKKSCTRHVVIHPYNPRRSAWDMASLVLVLYDMFWIPFSFFDPPDSTVTEMMEWITRIFWTMDMPASFVSGFVTREGSIELRMRPIVLKYLKGWFSLDMLVVGVDWIEIILQSVAAGLGFARLTKASRIFRILRMIRLLRLARMGEVLNLLTERLDSEKLVILIDVAKLIVLMVGSGHIIACIWYYIGKTDDTQKNWLVRHEYKDASIGFRYVMSLRWAISQYAGGMDEVVPVSMGENIYAIFIYLGAFWSGAVFLSILTSSMTQWYIMGSQQAQQLTTLRRYLSQNGISKKLALRVTRNAQHALKEAQRTMPEEAVGLVSEVSEPLRVEIHYEMYSPSLAIHPFFARYIEECPHVVRKICHTACHKSHVSVGDTIFNFGEMPSKPRMFILTKGLLIYSRVGHENHQVDVNQWNWVSEACLWVEGWTHRGTLIAQQDCRLFSLDAKEFQTIAVQFEHMGTLDPRAYAQEFVDCFNDMEEPCDVHNLSLQNFIDRYLGLAEDRKTAFAHHVGDFAHNLTHWADRRGQELRSQVSNVSALSRSQTHRTEASAAANRSTISSEVSRVSATMEDNDWSSLPSIDVHTPHGRRMAFSPTSTSDHGDVEFPGGSRVSTAPRNKKSALMGSRDEDDTQVPKFQLPAPRASRARDRKEKSDLLEVEDISWRYRRQEGAPQRRRRAATQDRAGWGYDNGNDNDWLDLVGEEDDAGSNPNAVRANQWTDETEV